MALNSANFLALRLLGLPLLFCVSHTSWAKEIVLSLNTHQSGQKIELAADFLRWGDRLLPLKEEVPGEYAVRFEEPWLPFIQYKFIVDGHWISDPKNSQTLPDGHGGWNSVLKVDGFREDPFLSPDLQSVPMKEIQITLKDREGDSRQITVLTPPGNRPSVTVYFQDGGDYLKRTGVQWLLARLSNESGIPPLTGVFIPPKDRMREYQLQPSYADFVATDLVSAIENRLPQTGGHRGRRLLIGPSLGGLITLYTALRHSDVFGLAASQSGSLWFNHEIFLQELGKPVKDPRHQLKIFMDCGIYETADMLQFNRAGFELAQRAGHSTVYREYPSTHSWIGWRNRLQETLRYFFATSTAVR